MFCFPVRAGRGAARQGRRAASSIDAAKNCAPVRIDRSFQGAAWLHRQERKATDGCAWPAGDPDWDCLGIESLDTYREKFTYGSCSCLWSTRWMDGWVTERFKIVRDGEEFFLVIWFLSTDRARGEKGSGIRNRQVPTSSKKMLTSSGSE